MAPKNPYGSLPGKYALDPKVAGRAVSGIPDSKLRSNTHGRANTRATEELAKEYLKIKMLNQLQEVAQERRATSPMHSSGETDADYLTPRELDAAAGPGGNLSTAYNEVYDPTQESYIMSYGQSDITPDDVVAAHDFRTEALAKKNPDGATAGKIINGVLIYKSLRQLGKGLRRFKPLKSPPTSTAAGEPVDVVSGEYLETWRDFVVPASLAFDGSRYMGLRLALPKAYVSPLGPCQISLFDEIFAEYAPGQVIFHQADGKVVVFDRPFNFLNSINPAAPHLQLRAPWLRQLELHDRRLVKHFRQYDDRIYRLERVEDLNGNHIILHRGEDGRLERAEGADGLSLAFANSAEGRRTHITLIGSDGSRLELARYSYGARGHMTAADCAFGMSVRYYWNAERDLLLRWHNVTKRSETRFTHDEAGRVVCTHTNGIWNDDRFRYEPANRETAYLPSGEERLAKRFRYDENDNVVMETDALGHSVHHTLDAAGFRTGTRDANGHATSTRYDPRGNVRHHVDAEGRSTVYAWGQHGDLDMVVDGIGKVRRWTNDQRGNTLAQTDAEGHETRFVRDERGRLLTTIFPDATEERRSYDAHGRLVAITDPRGGTMRFSHDPFGRVVETTDALGNVTRMAYAAGAGGFAAATSIVRPDGVRITRSFDADGVLATVTDGEGRSWRYVYGAFDVLQAVEDPAGGKLSFSYDGEGRLTGITNQVGATYHLIRDAAGRVIAEEDFDGRRTDYTRDPGGRVVETRKPDGVRLVHAYDRSDKVTSIKAYAAGASGDDAPLDEVHYWYDRRGLLNKASNRAALVEFELDGNGHRVREVVNGRAVESEFDECGVRVERRIGRAQTGEGIVRFACDPLGMITSIAIDGHAPLAFTRDALGRERRRASPQGFCLDQDWDGVGQMVSQRAGSFAASGLRAERRYEWDKASSPTKIDELMWGETRYAYNAIGQVAETSYANGAGEAFDYDPGRTVAGVTLRGPGTGADIGGLLAWQSTPGGVVQLARGPDGEAIALTHDACGRVVTRRVDRKGFRPKTWRYSWDAFDRLASCETPDGDTWYYRYDPFGRRLTKVRKLRDVELAWTAQKFGSLVPPDARDSTKIWTWPEPPAGARASDDRPPVVGTHFTWDGDVVAEEAPLRLDGTVDWDAATRWHFEPGGFRPLAKQTADDSLLHIVTDHLGTPREMFDESGALCWAASFTTWGVSRSVRTPRAANDDGRAIYPRAAATDAAQDVSPRADVFACPIRFQGQWQDEETGLHYNRFRYYDPQSTAYLSQDPLGLAGGERPSSYVLIPTKSVDPKGLYSKWEAAGWKDSSGNWRYPEHLSHGAEPGSEFKTSLNPGDKIDRYGGTGGNYTSPLGVPYEKRSLPPGSDKKPYKKYEVLKKIPVTEGKAAPWFGEPGGATQYFHDETIQQMLDTGQIKEIP